MPNTVQFNVSQDESGMWLLLVHIEQSGTDGIAVAENVIRHGNAVIAGLEAFVAAEQASQSSPTNRAKG